MIGIANSYYEAIVQDNGDVAPFADECERRENGGISANDQTQTPEEAANDDFSTFRKMKCGEQLSTGVMSYITDITDRRVFAVDEAKGLVFAFSIFRPFLPIAKPLSSCLTVTNSTLLLSFRFCSII